MEIFIQRPTADEGPESVHPRLARGAFEEHELLQSGAEAGVAPLDQEALGDIAEIDVGAAQVLDERVVRLLGEVETRDAGRVLVADAVEPPLEPVDSGGV